MIHGDLFQDNVLANDGEVKAVLDFEDVCINVLAIDLVVAFIGCSTSEGRHHSPGRSNDRATPSGQYILLALFVNWTKSGSANVGLTAPLPKEHGPRAEVLRQKGPLARGHRGACSDRPPASERVSRKGG